MRNNTAVVALIFSGFLLAAVIEMMWAITARDTLMFNCSAVASLISYLMMVVSLVKCAVKHTSMNAD